VHAERCIFVSFTLPSAKLERQCMVLVDDKPTPWDCIVVEATHRSSTADRRAEGSLPRTDVSSLSKKRSHDGRLPPPAERGVEESSKINRIRSSRLSLV
jgi:hypothetical protein